MFLAASWKNLEALILLALNTAGGNGLSFRPLISYISQCKNRTISPIVTIQYIYLAPIELSGVQAKSLRHVREPISVTIVAHITSKKQDIKNMSNNVWEFLELRIILLIKTL